MKSSAVEEFDVVVVGGGPGGSTVATLVARQGHRVLLLEKESFPRYQIGESLLPSTVHGICRLLNVTEELERAGFTRKRGGTFKWGSSPAPWDFTFSVSPKMTGPTSFAYQVERMKFDEILLRNAARAGVDVRENCPAGDVIAADGRVRGLRYVDADGQSRDVHTRFVVDASGNKSRIYKHVGGSRIYSEFFQNIAVFGYFEGGKRLPPPNSGNILSVAFDDGWFWYIPLSESLTSVGAVVSRERAHHVQEGAVQALATFIQQCPLIKEHLSAARRVTEGPYGEVRTRKDYSYSQTKFWCEGMVLVGDAACFVDPVFSSGVHLATYGALLAARSINSCLDGSLDEKRSFTEFEARYRREYSLFYEFLVAFYDMHQSEQSYFWKAKKVTSGAASELQAFVELVGGVASGEAALATGFSTRLSETARDLVEAVEQVAHVQHEGPVSLFGSSIVQKVMREGANIQMQAFLGGPATGEAPLFTEGLVPSADGTRWVQAS